IGLIFNGNFELMYQDYISERAEHYKNIDQEVQKIVEKYEKQFYCIRNTNFLEIMGYISSEDTNNYRNVLLNYFISYINSNIHIDEHFDLSVHVMVTKLLFFDTSNTQQILSTLLLGNSNDQFFFNYYTQFHRFL